MQKEDLAAVFAAPLAPSEELKHILPKGQRAFLRELQGADSPEYWGILADAEKQADNYKAMPALYDTDGKPSKERKIYLHYFVGGCDWWLLEKSADGEEFFGLCKIHEAEFGYVTANELKNTEVRGAFGIELDFHWKPTPLYDILADLGMETED